MNEGKTINKEEVVFACKAYNVDEILVMDIYPEFENNSTIPVALFKARWLQIRRFTGETSYKQSNHTSRCGFYTFDHNYHYTH